MTKREIIDQKIDNAKLLEDRINKLLSEFKQKENVIMILNIENDKVKIGLAINMDLLVGVTPLKSS